MLPRWRVPSWFQAQPEPARPAPSEVLGYVALESADPHARADALAVVNLNPGSRGFGRQIWQLDMPGRADGLDRLSWAPGVVTAPDGGQAKRGWRHLVAPATGSSRIYVVDTVPCSLRPALARTIDSTTLAADAGLARPFAVQAAPDAVYLTALGDAAGERPGGLVWLDPASFEIAGAWTAPGGQAPAGACEFGWHLAHEAMIGSAWPSGSSAAREWQPDRLLEGGAGQTLHAWDRVTRRHLQELPLGDERHWLRAPRPAHDQSRPYGFVAAMASLDTLSAAIWLWYLDGSNGDPRWRARKVVEIAADPAAHEALPSWLAGVGAAPPLVTDLCLSTDDRFLYVSCWGAGEVRQYDVSDPWAPHLTGAVRLGGIARRTGHPSQPTRPLGGGPQSMALSRDGRRLYVTNSLGPAWDEACHPDGFTGWMARLEVDPRCGLRIDERFFVEFAGYHPKQIRLSGGDASVAGQPD